MKTYYYDLNQQDDGSLELCKTNEIPDIYIIDSFDSFEAVVRNTVFLQNKAEEYCYMFTVNCAQIVTGICEISHGAVNFAIMRPREVFIRALMLGACGIFVVHNHPAGSTKPSEDDLRSCNRLKQSGEILGVPLLYFGILGKEFISFGNENLL